MLHRHEVTDAQWALIAPLLSPERGRKSRPAKPNRPMVNGMLWILKTGAPWRDLPLRFGPWKSVYTRFSRWSAQGIWHRVVDAVGAEHDGTMVMIDATIVRAHQDAAGVKRGGSEVIGASRGGLTTKIHAVVDAVGRYPYGLERRVLAA
ncbi:MAG: IS5 family transposase [Polyangiales bacterium]